MYRFGVSCAAACGALIVATSAFATRSRPCRPPCRSTCSCPRSAVPTEKENDDERGRVTPPSGSESDLSRPRLDEKPQRQVHRLREETTIEQFDMDRSGRSRPGGCGVPVPRYARLAKTYTFEVRQTYSNGRVVDWSGPESSDTPAPPVEAKSSLGGGGEQHPRVIALVVGGLALVLAVVGLSRAREAGAGVTRRARRAHRTGGGSRRRSRCRRRLRARRLVHTVPSASGDRQHARPAGRSPTARRSSRASRSSRSPTRRRTRRRPGRRARSATDPDTLVVPLKHLEEGWYLVYWRVISVDGHPVRGAFTFAVGPNPGPPPQFVIPSISRDGRDAAAARRPLDRLPLADGRDRPVRPADAIARPVVRRVPGTSLRAVSIAFFVALAVALVATPGLRPARDGRVRAALGLRRRRARAADARLRVRPRLPRPRARASRSSRVAAALAIWLDRPEREQRSVAELLALDRRARWRPRRRSSFPGLAGHAAQTSPRGLSSLFDWLHLAAGSIWVGGLIGLLVLWRSLPAARRVAGLVGLRAAFLERRVRSVLVADRLRASARRSSTCRRSPRCGRPRTARRCSSRSALLGAALLLAAVNLAAHQAAARGRARAPGARRAGAACCCAGSSAARCCSSGRDLRRRRALEPAAAARRRSRRSAAPRARRAGPRRRGRQTRTATGSTSTSPRTARPCRTPSGRHHARTASRSGTPTCARSRCWTWRWEQAYRLAETARRLRALGARARDGRALGALVRRSAPKAASRSPSCSSTGPTDERADVTRLAARCWRSRAGVAAVLVVALLAVDAWLERRARRGVCVRRRARRARADGDPASDYLLVQSVFLPFNAKVDPQASKELADTIRAANERGLQGQGRRSSGSRLRPRHGVLPLQQGAAVLLQFLGLELSFQVPRSPAFVMPNGYGVSTDGKADPVG